ncbi:hypothetical protein ACP70R_027137 [Stipagrostis hirtigluma subsp. patula]
MNRAAAAMDGLGDDAMCLTLDFHDGAAVLVPENALRARETLAAQSDPAARAALARAHYEDVRRHAREDTELAALVGGEDALVDLLYGDDLDHYFTAEYALDAVEQLAAQSGGRFVYELRGGRGGVFVPATDVQAFDDAAFGPEDPAARAERQWARYEAVRRNARELPDLAAQVGGEGALVDLMYGDVDDSSASFSSKASLLLSARQE